MGRIYSQAHSVVAWLGPASELSDLAVDVLSGWIEGGSESWRPISLLLGRPFWSRAWIIQELCKARKLQILCGSAIAGWGSMLTDIGVFRVLNTFKPTKDEPWDYDMRHFHAQDSHKNELLRALQSFGAREQQSRGVPQLSLLESLLLSRRSVATDPRDKVYALLSLASDGYDLVPSPNYTQPMEQLYSDVTRNIIAKQGSMAVLWLARRPSEMSEGLPS